MNPENTVKGFDKTHASCHSEKHIVINKLPRKDTWPCQDARILSSTHNTQCVLGITVVAEHKVDFPIYVADTLESAHIIVDIGTHNNTNTHVPPRPGYVYEVTAHLQAGINHIGWCRQSGISVDKHNGRNTPTLSFPGKTKHTMLTPLAPCYHAEEHSGAADCRDKGEPLVYSLGRYVCAPHPTVYARGTPEKVGPVLTEGWRAAARAEREAWNRGEEGSCRPWCSEVFLRKQETLAAQNGTNTQKHTPRHPVPTLALGALAQCLSHDSVGGKAASKEYMETHSVSISRKETRHWLAAVPPTGYWERSKEAPNFNTTKTRRKLKAKVMGLNTRTKEGTHPTGKTHVDTNTHT